MNSPFIRRHLLTASVAILCLLSSPCLATIRLQLSTSGVRAYQTVRSAVMFSGAAVGYAGTTPEVVWAFRDLLAEKNADAAFKALLQDPLATLPGQLYGLCGLWFTDQAAFKAQVARYRAMKGKVKTMIGCIIDQDPIRELVESKDTHAIRLRGPEDTVKAWRARNPKAEGRMDIAGGYWPSELKGEEDGRRTEKR